MHTLQGAPQVVVNGWREMAGYDLATGREVWRLHGKGDIPVPTPVIGLGMVFLTSAHGGAGTYAVKANARGDVTPAGETATSAGVAWSAKDAAYMQTPLFYGEHLYVCRDNGVLNVFDARTGTRVYQHRLGEGTTGFTASPVAANGRVFFTSEEGEVFVVKAGAEFVLLGKSALGETSLATPALSEGHMFFRTRDHVVAVPPAR